jgi:hypothetical protein
LVVNREPLGARIFKTGELPIFAILGLLRGVLRGEYTTAARPLSKAKKRLTRPQI